MSDKPKDVLEFSNGQLGFAVSTGDMSWNKTGSWRYMRPLYAEKTPPCTIGCPAGEKIPQYFALVKEKRYYEAWHLILEDNPLPGVCGRVCYHPCEGRCNRAEFDEPIAIHNMERFVADANFERHFPEHFKATPTGKKIAVVGSGPAGLSVAYHSARQGHAVTVFEAAAEPGGMLRLGIPKYRLPREVVDKEINDIASLGVKFRTNTRIGEDLSWEDLRRDFDAVVIATGAWRSRKLNVPGEDLPGVRSGLAFLKELNTTGTVAVGQRVAVIGGGNTAIDAARSALRLGAQVTIVYRRSRQEMPAVPEEIEEALAEGVQFHFLATPVAVEGEGKVQRLRLIRMELGEPDASGRRRPVPIAGSEFDLEVDQVLTAIGEVPELDFLQSQLETAGPRLKVDFFQHTGETGVFACGDAAAGPVGSVVNAISTGKKTAAAVDAFLRQAEIPRPEVRPMVSYADLNLDYFFHEERPKEQRRAEAETQGNFLEVNLGLTDEQAHYEAERCFSCGVCTTCDNCLIFCPDVAISRNAEGTGYVINYDYCKGCGICVHECPRDAMSFEEELKWSSL